MANNTVLDLDALLESTLDNVEDVPDYVTPPTGAYALRCEDCKIETYKSKKKGEENKELTRLRVTHAIRATIELKDSKEAPVADGSLFSETFMANEDGLKYFKKQAKAILNVEDLNGVPLRDVISSLLTAEYDAKISIRTTKGDDGSIFENVQVRIVPPAA